ncbi:MAG: DUF721 domain-containing protein [Pseudomonadota bacterium]
MAGRSKWLRLSEAAARKSLLGTDAPIGLAEPKPPKKTRSPREAASRAGTKVPLIVAQLAQKTRFVDPGLMMRWRSLVGDEVAAICRPGKLHGGKASKTLEVYVCDGAAAGIIQMRERAVIDNLNAYFGVNAIGRLLIRQTGTQLARRNAAQEIVEEADANERSTDSAAPPPNTGYRLSRFRGS